MNMGVSYGYYLCPVSVTVSHINIILHLHIILFDIVYKYGFWKHILKIRITTQKVQSSSVLPFYHSKLTI